VSRTAIRPGQLTRDIVDDHAAFVEDAQVQRQGKVQPHKEDCDCRRCVTRRHRVNGHDDPLLCPFYALGSELLPFPVGPNGERLRL
jgi:hypothetical protein